MGFSVAILQWRKTNLDAPITFDSAVLGAYPVIQMLQVVAHVVGTVREVRSAGLVSGGHFSRVVPVVATPDAFTRPGGAAEKRGKLVFLIDFDAFKGKNLVSQRNSNAWRFLDRAVCWAKLMIDLPVMPHDVLTHLSEPLPIPQWDSHSFRVTALAQEWLIVV